MTDANDILTVILILIATAITYAIMLIPLLPRRSIRVLVVNALRLLAYEQKGMPPLLPDFSKGRKP